MLASVAGRAIDVLKTEYPKANRGKEDGSWSFQVDKREPGDVSYLVCSICVTHDGSEADAFGVVMHNVPNNSEVEEAAAELGGIWSQSDGERSLSFTVTVKQHAKVKKLAKAIRRVVGRGQRYPYSHWRWSAPRTADSLEHLAGCFQRIVSAG